MAKTFHPIKHVTKDGKTVGYRVVAKSTGKPLSSKPLSHEQAVKQLAAVEFHRHNPGMK